jgi:hypothetical protein
MNRYQSQVREVINRNTVVSLALEQGFNAFLPVYDGGVDFVLYGESDGLLRKVQLCRAQPVLSGADQLRSENCLVDVAYSRLMAVAGGPLF